MRFGKTSKTRLSTCHPRLQHVANEALALGVMDITVVCGLRTKAEQDKLYPKYSKLKWPNSKHNAKEGGESMAVDLAPYHPKYGYLSGHPTQIAKIAKAEGITKAEVTVFIASEYNRLAGVVLAAAKANNVKLRWGGDWDGDRNVFDQSFTDLPHFELNEDVRDG
jgi:hypothetical protein